MDSSNQEGQEKKRRDKLKVLPVPFALEEIKDNIYIKTNTHSTFDREQIIREAFKLHAQGNIQKALKYYQYFLNQGHSDYRVFLNYGVILKDLGKLKEAELLYRKAIELKSDYAEAHSNLGSILAVNGKLKEAELSARKAIQFKPNFAMAYSNLGNILRDLGKLKEAELSQLKAIELNPTIADIHSNLGIILRDLGKLKEAELSQLKAIKIKPEFTEAHYNLGNLLIDLGKLKEAELSYLKATKLNPNFAKAYYSLSTFKYIKHNRIWKDKLFTDSILNRKSKKDKIDIFFARANILHNEKKYKDCSSYLKLANNIKLNLHPSNADNLINLSQKLLIESDNKKISKKEDKSCSENIFIVGMPRSGSTLLESILSKRNDVYDLGELNILEESFNEYNRCKQKVLLSELYKKKINKKTRLNITTNKWLYNYQYSGIIAVHIPNAKIIHCYRNPLDNILSIYRAHFARGNEYSSSLVDCARVYLDQEILMKEYKSRFRSKIYDLNYDSLVGKPNKEIKSLISWLGWKWENTYLSPHLNTRSVSTASNIQVRSPINSKSVGGWKNYKEMLKPSIEVLTQHASYKDLVL